MRIFLGFFIVIVMMPSMAMACSCATPTREKAKAAYADTEVIVRARVLQVSGGWGTMTPIMRLEIIETLKGNDIPPVIMANYNNNTAACGYDYQQGDEDIFAIFDTRDIGLTANNARGYGFRVMQACHGAEVKYFVENIIEKETSY